MQSSHQRRGRRLRLQEAGQLFNPWPAAWSTALWRLQRWYRQRYNLCHDLSSALHVYVPHAVHVSQYTGAAQFSANWPRRIKSYNSNGNSFNGCRNICSSPVRTRLGALHTRSARIESEECAEALDVLHSYSVSDCRPLGRLYCVQGAWRLRRLSEYLARSRFLRRACRKLDNSAIRTSPAGKPGIAFSTTQIMSLDKCASSSRCLARLALAPCNKILVKKLSKNKEQATAVTLSVRWTRKEHRAYALYRLGMQISWAQPQFAQRWN